MKNLNKLSCARVALILSAVCLAQSCQSAGGGKTASRAPIPAHPPARVPAFPGAEGGGEWTVGGRGGKVFAVTTLEDAGPGSLREAIDATGPRTVVFRVGGNIKLKSKLLIVNPNITIAGQTAPGDGICISGNSFWVSNSQTIIRHIRIRPGLGTGTLTDGLGGRPVGDIMIDHVSASWAPDENISLFKQEDKENNNKPPNTENITVQWCIDGETAGRRWHPYGITWGGKNASYHHNLHAANMAWEAYSSVSYNPSPENLDLRNNVLYTWRNRKLDGGQGGTINLVNNFFILDPQRKELDKQFVILDVNKHTGLKGGPASTEPARWFMNGNVIDGMAAETADNWADWTQAPNLDKIKAASAFPTAPIAEQSAQDAYEAVLAGAGATLPARDSVDARIVDATKNRKTYYGKQPAGIPDEDFTFPEYKNGEAPADKDGDGMPDAWESAHGLDAANAADGALDVDNDGYTNLEEYLNGTEPKDFVDYNDAKNNVDVLGKSQR